MAVTILGVQNYQGTPPLTITGSSLQSAFGLQDTDVVIFCIRIVSLTPSGYTGSGVSIQVTPDVSMGTGSVGSMSFRESTWNSTSSTPRWDFFSRLWGGLYQSIYNFDHVFSTSHSGSPTITDQYMHITAVAYRSPLTAPGVPFTRFGYHGISPLQRLQGANSDTEPIALSNGVVPPNDGGYQTDVLLFADWNADRTAVVAGDEARATTILSTGTWAHASMSGTGRKMGYGVYLASDTWPSYGSPPGPVQHLIGFPTLYNPSSAFPTPPAWWSGEFKAGMGSGSGTHTPQTMARALPLWRVNSNDVVSKMVTGHIGFYPTPSS